MDITKRRNGDITILDLKGKLTIGDGAEVLRDTIASSESEALASFH